MVLPRHSISGPRVPFRTMLKSHRSVGGKRFSPSTMDRSSTSYPQFIYHPEDVVRDLILDPALRMQRKWIMMESGLHHIDSLWIAWYAESIKNSRKMQPRRYCFPEEKGLTGGFYAYCRNHCRRKFPLASIGMIEYNRVSQQTEPFRTNTTCIVQALSSPAPAEIDSRRRILRGDFSL